MSEILKQLRIKTSTLKRLKKEFISYEKETTEIAHKIETFEAQQQTEDLSIEIRKHKEFLQESESVLSNVKQKLIEAFEALTIFLSEKQSEESLQATEELKVAEDTVLDVEAFLESLAE